jgi:secreted PhoX family phosphatase
MSEDHRIANLTGNEPMRRILHRRLSRRGVLRGAAAASVLAWMGPRRVAAEGADGLGFEELKKGLDDTHHVAPGYRAEPLLRWGDPVTPGAPQFDPRRQSVAAQEKQFGYNCDFTAFMPLPRGTRAADRGLLAVNHETTNAGMMFPDLGDHARPTRTQVAIELAAHGLSIVEIRRDENGAWRPVPGGPMNRRITARSTVFGMRGPAAGHARLRTLADPAGKRVIGTLNNCAGGVTPWGTVLSAEENWNVYFSGDPTRTDEERNYRRFGILGEPQYPDWGRHFARFDLAREPNEPNRFGWIVEIDPYDRRSLPVKRTALGRFKHEGAATILNKDGRVVVYCGDDQEFEYVYRFVSAGRFDPERPERSPTLLDSGVLSVARFSDDGTLLWLPLVFGEGPLTRKNGFKSQADVLIETRRAADLLGATPMDRPEDIEPNPVTGSVFASFTGNSERRANQVSAANPRAQNKFGHILELIPPGGRGGEADHAAGTFRWEVFLLAGNPADPAQGARYLAPVGEDGWLAHPDNLAVDPKGRLWIATDGAERNGFADGLWASAVDGPERGLPRHFFRVPRGAELTGPSFTPDGSSLFVSVQHPGLGSDYRAPSTRWPDFDPGLPPRPSVVAITREDGGPIA